MNDEIKEILDRLDYNEGEVALYRVPITWCELYDIRDYITNLQQDTEMYAQLKDEYEEEIKELQQENERLQENNSNMQEEMARVWEENERLKAQNLHLSDLYNKSFDTLCKAQEYIRNNVWNADDKDKIKELLLIIWNSLYNQEFEVKTKKVSDEE